MVLWCFDWNLVNYCNQWQSMRLLNSMPTLKIDEICIKCTSNILRHKYECIKSKSKYAINDNNDYGSGGGVGNDDGGVGGSGKRMHWNRQNERKIKHNIGRTLYSRRVFSLHGEKRYTDLDMCVVLGAYHGFQYVSVV